MAKSTTVSPELLIAGQYAVDVSHPLEGAGGGLPAYAAVDRRSPGTALMAVQARPLAPPRARALATLQQAGVPGLLGPLAYGRAGGPDGREACFVICPAPPGRSLAATPGRWTEGELLDHLLRPAATCLDALQAKGVTHRAIRPDNLFNGGAGRPIVLGSAWAAPPASLQPALFEPPYSAMCLPAGRGEGCIADDVYALGVSILVLALGQVPLAGMDPAGVIRRKLELGSYAALVGDARLPAALTDLLRGMLAEDPVHRPTPLLLLDPAAARARRVATRPSRRAQRPLLVADLQVWEARTLAYAIALNPEEGSRLLRGGMVDHWLRRSLGDATLSAQLEEAVGQRLSDSPAEDKLADSTLAMRGVALLDPLAPLCWQGVALWPDGLGPALADARGRPADHSARLEALVGAEAVAAWAGTRPDTSDTVAMRHDARQNRLQLRARGLGGGLLRVLYGLNPMLGCGSKLLEGRFVAKLEDLLPALDAVAAQPELRTASPVDAHVAAFLAAAQDQRVLADVPAPGAATALAPLRILARLQMRVGAPAVPGLAAWLAEQAAPALSNWHNRPRRAAVEQRLAGLAASGQLAPMLALLDDPEAREADERGLQEAKATLGRIDLALGQLERGAGQRHEAARRIGHEIAAGIGLTALASVLAAAALG